MKRGTNYMLMLMAVVLIYLLHGGIKSEAYTFMHRVTSRMVEDPEKKTRSSRVAGWWSDRVMFA